MSTIPFHETDCSSEVTKTGCYRFESVPVYLAGNDTCLPGFYCPNSSDKFPPQYCPPCEKCQVARMVKKTCNPQGLHEPKICANGHYCPPGGKKQIQCPKGTFCPSGAVQPSNCSSGAICPANSERQIVTMPLGFMAGLDCVLVLLVLGGSWIAKWRRSRSTQYTSLGGGDGQADDIELMYASPKIEGRRTVSPALSVSTPGSPTTHPLLRPHHARRVSGRVDCMDGRDDADNSSLCDSNGYLDDDSKKNIEFQRFLHSMGTTIETDTIGLRFDFENLSVKTNKGKMILQEVTGTIPRGSCWGIMGASGAGKSTLVNALMGKSTAHGTGGTIKINGWTKDMSKYRKLIGYVPQDDVCFPELTVRENILHSARTRLPSSWKDTAVQEHVDSLMACLQLTHVQHSRVGDARRPFISGGQRKRVNIGMELAAAPMAIFLDEPTSGLDATSAVTIMRLLRAISRLGVTTIAIIHQPREQIFYGFDQLLLLTDGRSVYSGPTDDVQNYFEKLGFAFPQRANPADAVIDIITGNGAQYSLSPKHHTGVDTLVQEWASRGHYDIHSGPLTTMMSLDGAGSKSPRRRTTSNQSINSTAEQEESLARTMKRRGASWPAQVYYCWKRAMTQQIRNASSFFFEIAVAALAGTVIGLSAFASKGHLFQGIYHPPFTLLSSATDYHGTLQLGLLSAMAIGLAASAPGVWVFGEEKQMFDRETASGHSKSAYYVGKVLSTLARISLCSLHFTVLQNILAAPLMSFSRQYTSNLAYFWCIYGLASIVSILVKRENGALIAVLASLVLGILGGVAPPLTTVKQWHLEWLWRLFPGVWFTESYFTENLMPLGYLYDVELAAETVGFTLDRYGMDVGILFAIGTAYRVCAYLCLIRYSLCRWIRHSIPMPTTRP